MSQAETILALAKGEIGVREDASGRVKYNVEYGLIGAWCVMFIWWVFKHCNLSKLFYDGKKVASCTKLYEWAHPLGLTVPKGQAKRGDLIIFEFGTANNPVRHIGICESFDGTYITTIDGNTCEVGNEADGYQVMRRRRHINTVKWVVRPEYTEQKEMLEKPNAVYYVVKKGDYFNKIAKEHNLTVDRLKQLNPQIKNINIIYVGQKVRVK